MENHERHKMIANFWEITYRLEVLVWRKTILQKHPCKSSTDIATNVYMFISINIGMILIY